MMDDNTALLGKDQGEAGTGFPILSSFLSEGKFFRSWFLMGKERKA